MAGESHTPVSPLGGVKAFQCRNCGGQIQLRAPGQTLAAACIHCGSVTDLSDENLRIIQEFNSKMTRKPLIPIGSRGELEGTTWEVIGFLIRKADKYQYFWEEYLLFNPYHGFRWLLNQYGHWSYTQPLVDHPEQVGNPKRYQLGGTTYRPFSRGKATVQYVLGEFYWKVKAGEKVRMMDYIAPPNMLSLEQDANGKSWSRSTYLQPEAVQKAFPDLKKIPHRSGVVGHQPNKYARQLKDIVPIMLVALALLVVGQIFFVRSARDEVAHRFEQLVEKTTPEGMVSAEPLVSPPFELGAGTTNAEVTLRAPGLSNSWIEINGFLNNKETNQSYPFQLAAEYYSGISGGESWSEGSKSVSRILNNVPAGTYTMGLEIALGATSERINVVVTRDVPIWSNFWILLVAFLVFPFYLAIRSSNFEKLRQSESDL